MSDEKPKYRLGYLKPALARTGQPTTSDFHWAAGIYEGEGYSAYSQGTEHVEIPQKDPWILERLQYFFGGSVTYKPSGGIHKWVLLGARARGFLQSIYGLLSPWRQKQAREALRK